MLLQGSKNLRNDSKVQKKSKKSRCDFARIKILRVYCEETCSKAHEMVFERELLSTWSKSFFSSSHIIYFIGAIVRYFPLVCSHSILQIWLVRSKTVLYLYYTFRQTWARGRGYSAHGSLMTEVRDQWEHTWASTRLPEGGEISKISKGGNIFLKIFWRGIDFLSSKGGYPLQLFTKIPEFS